MASKDQMAKDAVIAEIEKIFGNNFLGISDKKVYVLAKNGNGEMVQVCLALTIPKNPIAFDNYASVPAEASGGDFDWSIDTPAPTPKAPVEISEAERKTVEELMAKLGL